MKTPEYMEKVRTTDDIEFLRKELMQHHDLTNRLHRRTQSYESVMMQVESDKKVLEEDLKWVRSCYNRYQDRVKGLWGAVDKMPFPLNIWVRYRLHKAWW